MASRWQKNQATASLRRCMLKIRSLADGTRAPRATDFTGFVYISQGGVAQVLGLGTIENNRRNLVVADFTFTAAVTDIVTRTAHTLETGDGPFRLTTTTTLPAGLALATDYWIIKIDADTYYYATTAALAYAGTRVDITSTGTGTHTLADVSTTQRGIDGEWWYTATQAETNYDMSEGWVTLAHVTYEGEASIDIITEAASVWDVVGEDGHTYGDLMRAMVSVSLARMLVSGTTYTLRDLANTKNRITGTITASGRDPATVIDLT